VVLVVLFWFLYARLHRQEFLRWWGLAWTSFVAYLATTAFVLNLAPEWTLFKSSLVLFSVLARFLQIPLLVFAAWCMRLQELRLRRWLRPGIGVALIAGTLSFAASFIYRDQPVISFSLRSVPNALGLAAALVFYGFSFFDRWQGHRSSTAIALAGMSCLLYALDQLLYSADYIYGLIAGPSALRRFFTLPLIPAGVALSPSVDSPLFVHPALIFLELISSCGICLGMLLLVMEEHHQADSASREIAARSRQLAEDKAVLSAEINERKFVEQTLKEKEDLYRDLVEHSEDLLCTHNLKGRLLSVNPAPARVLGYEVEQLLQMSLQELLVPRFRDRFDTYIARIQRKGVARGLMTVLTRSGEERTWEYHNTLRTEGVPSPIVRGMAHDVTEKIQAEWDLRQSEAKFATAFRSSPSAMMISTLPDGQFIDVNDAFERQTGYGRAEVIGRTAFQLGMWADRTEWEKVEAELRNRTGVKNREMRLRTRANHTLTVSYSAEIIQLVGKPCVLAVGEDITARKLAEEKLRNLSSQLVQAQEEERARIARELHDDVNQRLAVLALRLQELKRNSLSSSSLSQLDALSKLTTEISIDVRKVSHHLHPAVLDLLGLVGALSEFCQEFAKMSEMKIEFVHHHVPPMLPKEVTLCLYRVVQEAIRNAQKHSGCPEARVELTGASDSIRLRVSDSGAGFDPAFVPSDRLGLISMAERLRSLGGELSVQSRPGHGTSIEARIVFQARPNDEGKVSKRASGRSHA
jgi:PAS domain S-box-containing protein